MSASSSSSHPISASGDEYVIEQPRAKRKKISFVWEHYTKVKGVNNTWKVKCNYCGKLLAGNCGTSHLQKHILNTCPNKPNIDLDGSSVIEFAFDQMKSRKELAIACIKHKFAFNIGEYEYFETFLRGLNPTFELPCRKTIRADVINVYEEEKVKMFKLLNGVESKVSLTTDMWTSEHSHVPYCCLTVHFIDENWELQKRIIAFKELPYPHGGENLFDFMKDSILKWNLDKRIFSVVVDNALSNNSMIMKLKTWLISKDLIHLNGDLLHVRCSAHILNLVVQDGLKPINGKHGLIDNIRETARYLKRSPSAAQKFESALEMFNLKGERQIAMDVPNRWNATYLLLETAIPLRKALCHLERIDKNYTLNPSEFEWDNAIAIHGCLKIFYEVTNRFSGSLYPTSNVFFPDICKIKLKLKEMKDSGHAFIQIMAGEMKTKFDKYWDKCSLVLAVAVVFDPRYKLSLVKYYYTKIDKETADRYVARVRDTFKDLFFAYGGDSVSIPDIPDETDGVSSSIPEAGSQEDYERWINEENGFIVNKLEWETYLDEPSYHNVENFSILNWWKVNNLRFPILSKIARDILAVPATTVASEAAFSVGGRVIDESRASLNSDAVEALVVADDWIRPVSK